MQFERSAGIFKAGIFMAIGGPLLSTVGGFVAAPSIAAFYTGNPNRGALIIGAMVGLIGLLITLAGYIMILVAVYRALVKIDALPVRQQPRITPAPTPGYDY